MFSERISVRRYVLAPLAALMVPVFPISAELYFNPRFLSDDPAAVADLSRFEGGQELPPGTYRVDIYLNNAFVATRDVAFQAQEGQQDLMACLTAKQLLGFGVNTRTIPGVSVLAADACIPFKEVMPDATQQFDTSQQRLYLTVPQIYMGNTARGYISPEYWDSGITGARLNYSLTGNQARSRHGGNSQYAYMNLNGGVNMGSWRLRDNSTWSYSSGGGATAQKNTWQHINTYAERDIVPLRSRLTLGDSTTAGDIFDGVQFRGIRVATDDNMLPDSQKGFAPVIRGIARGTAKVSVRQNGYEIYQTTVPPGPFEINDLYAAGNSGDLQVTIREADGSTRSFNVPYSSVPALLREGHSRFELTVAEYRSGSRQQQSPTFVQGSLMRGLPDGWTLYGGAQLSDKFHAFNAGVGKNMGYFGAMSLDITDANATLPDDSEHRGQSVRFLYNKSLSDTGTNLQLLGYRYSTQGYFTLADTAWEKMSGYTIQTQDGPLQIEPKYTDYYNLAYSKRGRLQVNVSQQIGRETSLYLSASRQSYWRTRKADEQLQAGLSSVTGGVNWSMNYSLTKNAWQDERDHLVSFNMSIPFSYWMGSNSKSVLRNSRASYSTSNDLDGKMTQLAGVSGTLTEDNNLNYSVQTGYSGGGNQASGSTGYAALNYTGRLANANVGYSQSDSYSQFYYGVSGGVLAHENGVTLSQPLNDTVVLVKVPGAANVKVDGQKGVRTDWRGYAVIPYAMNYRENRIALDTNTLASNVDLEDAVTTVIPSQGAIVRADFQANVGLKVLMTLNKNGKPVPFGAIATASGNQSGSIVADGGQVYLTGLPLTGQVFAKWGDSPEAQCKADYRLPPESAQRALNEISAECE
ncbi:fimbrial biogenesis usher protein [Serratia sp. JSRIV001]|uniref:fimbrial biogenesis usher protein n=1 Tax=Serratia TaxID=613 RepID=UPI0004A3E4BA|nr:MULTISPECIES: fimbrial biogenesis usher protein [Serratia]UAN45178.1 fimbrial biogenesis usher protein [Serratia sp. JSRIV001]UAN45202.1 fimbrial biogenesis usher protein [Serratia sp. JSRIV001]UAN54524.1 fimbrial biogenesis usher protein [Serratia sp. JSRIV002]UAN60536.1 fimbrial biogenesis usher protein [Serratia sp. JSRIV004]